MGWLKELWYRYFAGSLLAKNKELNDVVNKLTDEIGMLTKPKPLDADVNHLLRESLYRALDQDSYPKKIRELNGRLDLMKQHLKQVMAENLYLDDVRKMMDVCDFNGLEKETQNRYVKVIEEKIS